MSKFVVRWLKWTPDCSSQEVEADFADDAALGAAIRIYCDGGHEPESTVVLRLDLLNEGECQETGVWKYRVAIARTGPDGEPHRTEVYELEVLEEGRQDTPATETPKKRKRKPRSIDPALEQFLEELSPAGRVVFWTLFGLMMLGCVATCIIAQIRHN